MKTNKNKTGKLTELAAVGIMMAMGALVSVPSFAQTPVTIDEGGLQGGGGDPNELAAFIGQNGIYLDSWYSVRQDLIQGLRMNRHLELDLGSIDKDQFKEKAIETLQTVKVEWDDLPIVVDGTPRPCENSIDYPISSQISMQLKEVTVQKWSVHPSGSYSETQDIAEIYIMGSGILNEMDGNHPRHATIYSVYKDAKSSPVKRIYTVYFTQDNGGCSHNNASISVFTKSKNEMDELARQYSALSREQQIYMQTSSTPNPYFRSLGLKLESKKTCR